MISPREKFERGEGGFRGPAASHEGIPLGFSCKRSVA